MKVIDLFSGIGGFSLGLESAGAFETIQFVENEPWCQKILAKNFPGVPIAGDIREYEGQRADVVVGGFPCQPFSVAGKRKGTRDDRHLWPEMLRVIKASKPRWVIGENVRNLTSIQDGMVFEQVCTDLENEGYEVQSFVIPASAVNAPHQRYRVWIVAHSNNNGQQGGLFETRNQTFTRQRSKIIRRNGANMLSGSGNDGRNQTESTVNGTIQGSCHGNKTESSATERLCGLSEESNNYKNTLRADKYQENHDRTLVQERQQGLQSSEHKRLGDDKTTFERNKVRPGDDAVTRDRVETKRNVANTNNTGDRTSEHGTQRSGEKIDQRRQELTQFESSRLCADVANSDSWLRRRRRAIEPSRENKDRELHSAQEEQATKHIRSKIIRRSSIRGERVDVPHTEEQRLERYWQSSSQKLNKEHITSECRKERCETMDHERFSIEPNVGRVAHGIPNRVDRLKGLGNAIVPQIAYQIGLAILQAEKEK